MSSPVPRGQCGFKNGLAEVTSPAQTLFPKHLHHTIQNRDTRTENIVVFSDHYGEQVLKLLTCR